MIPTMIYPGDTIKTMSDAILVNTHKLIKGLKEEEVEDPQRFIAGIVSIPKGTVLEVSQITIKERGHSDNTVSFKVKDGTMHPSYNKFVLSKEKMELEASIAKLKTKLDTVSEVSPVRPEIVFDIKNRQKRLDSLTKQELKKGFTKLIKISMQDVESWKIKLT